MCKAEGTEGGHMRIQSRSTATEFGLRIVWRQNGRLHRLDGIATCYNGSGSYYIEDRWIYPNGYPAAVERYRTAGSLKGWGF